MHLILLALYPSFSQGIPEWALLFGGPAAPSPPQGTELVNLRELTPSQEREVTTRQEEEPEVQEVAVEVARPGEAGPPGPERPAEAEAEPGLSAAERLRARAGDLRLWAPVDPELSRLTEEQIMRLMLIAELEALGDSMALAEELARQATDWTYTDSEGKKWGVSPGRIHLGDLTLPLPFAFGPPPGKAGEIRDRVWEWDQIERGAATGELLRSWRERDEAIRRRMEAQRRPDTTKIQR